jgi:hypothetical protein
MPRCALAHIRLSIQNWADINKQKIKGKLVKVWKAYIDVIGFEIGTYVPYLNYCVCYFRLINC